MNRKTITHRLLIISVTFILLSGISLHALAKTEDGLNSLNIGEFEKAAAIFNEVLKGDADNLQASYYLGISLLLQEKFNEALDIFQNLKATAVDNSEMPAKGQIEIGLVRAYLGLKNYPEALKSLKAAEAAKTDQVDIHTYKGAYYLEINKNTRAKEELDKALELKSQNPYTYYYSGIINIRLGNPQKAIKLFEMFLKMAPYVPEAEHAKFLIDTLC